MGEEEIPAIGAEARVEIRWFLYVLMAHSEGLARWLAGGTC